MDLAQDQVRFVQAVQGAHAIEQFVGHAVHDLAYMAVHVGMQAAEVGHARRRAHAAQKAVAFDQQHVRAVACRAGRGEQAGGTAAEHHDFIFAVQCNLPGGFGDHHVVLLALFFFLRRAICQSEPASPSFLMSGPQRLSS